MPLAKKQEQQQEQQQEQEQEQNPSTKDKAQLPAVSLRPQEITVMSEKKTIRRAATSALTFMTFS